MTRGRRGSRGRTVVGTPGWVYVSDLVGLLGRAGGGANRWSAWRLMCRLREQHGARDVQCDVLGDPPRRRWRARTEVVAAHFRSISRETPEARLAAVEARIAELEDAVAERDQRLDALTDELRRAIDRLSPRR